MTRAEIIQEAKATKEERAFLTSRRPAPNFASPKVRSNEP